MSTKLERKEKAIEVMKTLDIYKPYIDGFEKKDRVCFFERFGGFWVEQEPEIEKKMKEIEKEYNCTVYAITHEYTEFGECYSFMLISDYPEEWEYAICENGNREFNAFAYVWNRSDDDCSEFGDVGIKSFGGGLARIY